MTRKAPYTHSDGSNCWTKDCRIRRSTQAALDTQKKQFMKDILDAQKKNEISADEAQGLRTQIDAIATQEEFDAAVANQEVSRQRHPEYPYSIYKYSQSTTFSKNWNKITMASRGLIVNDETGEILARPFPKFFNYSENATPAELMQGPISVMEKKDGSLGILFPTPDGLQISTAGGFQSPQAAHATELYRERYDGKWKPRKGTTYLYEIIYKENRIVLDYQNEDDIHLLGAVNIKTGKSIPISELKEWKWKRAEEFSEFKDVNSVVGAPDRSNHEGYVVHFTDTDTRVKIKHEEYLRHHRFATNVNSKGIHALMRDSATGEMDSWRKNAPEEFEDYINDKITTFTKKYNEEYSAVESYHKAVKDSLPAGYSQKDFALKANETVPSKYRGLVFSLHNRGELDDKAKRSIWNMFEPAYERSVWSQQDNVAGGDDES